MPDSTANLYSFMPPTINQSERDYSIRHGAYVRCFNQSEHSYGVRHGVNVHSFSQSERGYGVRHGVYHYHYHYTYAVLTNQSTAIVYVTVCTSRGVRTLFDQSGHDILMRVRPLNMCAPPRTPSRPLKTGG